MLLKAATTNRDPREAMVRRGACRRSPSARSISRNSSRRGRSPTRTRADARSASRRRECARPLGDRLCSWARSARPPASRGSREMVDDPHADTRYNAAIALAQHGNVGGHRHAGRDARPGRDVERPRGAGRVPAQFYKRSLIVTNALEAVGETGPRESDRRLHAGGRSARQDRRRRSRRPRTSAVPSDDRPAGEETLKLLNSL